MLISCQRNTVAQLTDKIPLQTLQLAKHIVMARQVRTGDFAKPKATC